MKRAIIITMILFCTALVFAQQNTSQTGTLSGYITDLSGTVELKAAGQTDYVPAKAGDAVSSNTIISTGFKSTALITVGSTVLTVRPLTRLSLSEISASAGTEKINVSLQTGRVRVDVKPPAGTKASMSVSSPMATASVRGTSFEFDTQSLTVLEGTVAFQGAAGQTMMVGAGASSDINSGGKPADPAGTYADSIVPQPPAGREAGYRHTLAAAGGELVFRMELR